jgi:hypothetical protein
VLFDVCVCLCAVVVCVVYVQDMGSSREAVVYDTSRVHGNDLCLAGGVDRVYGLSGQVVGHARLL